MYAFAPSTPLASVNHSIRNNVTTPLAHRPSRPSSAPVMVLRQSLRSPASTSTASSFGGVGQILDKADTYMAKGVLRQYLNMSNPTGEFGVQCTEGSVKGAAEAARIRALNTRFRGRQASVSAKYGNMYDNRKMAVSSSHQCHHEESQFVDYPSMTACYNTSKSEALGTCYRYATPETVEEAAMLRYMDIAQNVAANPSGVYSIACNEGASKGASEDLRVASLNAAFRNGQKPVGQLLNEKYQQKKYGYAACHGCNYEEGLVSLYPAIGAAFRPKTYGY